MNTRVGPSEADQAQPLAETDQISMPVNDYQLQPATSRKAGKRPHGAD
jgi:hypothetical protein